MSKKPSAADRLVAQRLAELRIAAGLSVEALATRASLAQSELSAIENGGTASPAALEALALALGVRVVAFFELGGRVPDRVDKLTRH